MTTTGIAFSRIFHREEEKKSTVEKLTRRSRSHTQSIHKMIEYLRTVVGVYLYSQKEGHFEQVLDFQFVKSFLTSSHSKIFITTEMAENDHKTTMVFIWQLGADMLSHSEAYNSSVKAGNIEIEDGFKLKSQQVKLWSHSVIMGLRYYVSFNYCENDGNRGLFYF